MVFIFVVLFLVALGYSCSNSASSTEKVVLNSGMIKWVYPVKGEIGYVTFKRDRIYLFEKKQKTGLWSLHIVSTKGRLLKTVDLGIDIFPPVLVTEDEVFIARSGFNSNRVVVFNSFGKVERRIFSKDRSTFKEVLYKDKTIFCFLSDDLYYDNNRLVALGIDANGRLIKKWVVRGISSPVRLSSGNVIYAVKERVIRLPVVDYKLVAIDISNGQVKRECDFNRVGDFVVDNDGNVIVRTDLSVYKMDKYCHVEWKYRENIWGPTNIYPTSDTIYFIANWSTKDGYDKRLVAVDSRTGIEKWTISIPDKLFKVLVDPKTGKEEWAFLLGDFHANFAVRNGKVYLVASPVRLYILDTQGNLKREVLIKADAPFRYRSIIGVGDDGTIYLHVRLQTDANTWNDSLLAIEIPE
jgi:outer membrane protein assembly factor BamB